mmetsp:Transcript_119447/g.207953  ORF Transcript_119447/g.207953 Transcript_119447/m.207953 type:complete len:207 (-) Transcript_119447:379-999(-)
MSPVTAVPAVSLVLPGLSWYVNKEFHPLQSLPGTPSMPCSPFIPCSPSAPVGPNTHGALATPYQNLQVLGILRVLAVEIRVWIWRDTCLFSGHHSHTTTMSMCGAPCWVLHHHQRATAFVHHPTSFVLAAWPEAATDHESNGLSTSVKRGIQPSTESLGAVQQPLQTMDMRRADQQDGHEWEEKSSRVGVRLHREDGWKRCSRVDS